MKYLKFIATPPHEFCKVEFLEKFSYQITMLGGDLV